MNLDWNDIHWEDPDGGTIVLHGVLPTVVLPNGMRPRISWHGLGIMGSSEEIEVWAEEEKSESKDPGICLLYTSPSPRDLSTSRMPSSA